MVLAKGRSSLAFTIGRFLTYRGVLGAGRDTQVIKGIPLDVHDVAPVPTHFGVMGVHLPSLRKRKSGSRGSGPVTSHPSKAHLLRKAPKAGQRSASSVLDLVPLKPFFP